MTPWTNDEPDRIQHADELSLTPLRDDGTLAPPTTIRGVRHGAQLFGRAYRGRGGAWFRAARARHQGRISGGGVERDLAFVGVAGASRAATLKLAPR